MQVTFDTLKIEANIFLNLRRTLNGLSTARMTIHFTLKSARIIK